MDKILALVNWKELPDYECLFAFDAVATSAAQWKKRSAPIGVARRQVYEEAKFRDARSAERAGVEAGLLCRDLALDAWYVGGWSRWAGVEGEPWVKEPYKNMQTFVTAFRISAPSNTKLIYKGISSTHTGKLTGYRRLHDAALMAQFDHVCVPNFGTDPERLRDLYRQRTFKYRLVVDCFPEFGVGRFDRRGDLWGDWHTTHSLLVDTKPSAVSFSFCKGARLQMRVGHPYHPALLQCVKEI